jgi:hypothetical protein
MTRDELIDKIRKVEALFTGTDSPGERQAARGALDRLKAQLESAPEEATAWQFSLPDPWKRQLFLALVRRHGLKPYREYRQRHATVMIRTTRGMVDQVLWPQYLELSKLLHDYLDEATRDIITRGVHGDLSEAPEQPNLPLR